MELAPFSKNQKEYFFRTMNSWLNVAEGGKRGGKNIVNTLAFCVSLEEHPATYHLIAGVTQGTAGLNVLDCDGFGVRDFFKGRCKDGKIEGRNCLYIKTNTGDKVVLIAGGHNKGDEAYIKGFTLGSAYITEVNECTEEFLNELMDRTLSSPKRKIFLDLNPKAPRHWFYSWLQFHEQKQADNPSYGYNYGHFTIADNMSIRDDKLRKILNTYDKKTAWYRRDIRGLRCAAEGLVYQAFADDPNQLDCDLNTNFRHRVVCVSIGVDFGGNKSQHAFVCSGITIGMKEVVVYKSKVVKAKGLSPNDLYAELVKFIKEMYDRFRLPIKLRCDSAEQTLIQGIKKAILDSGLPVQVMNAIKKPIVDRIRITNSLIQSKRLRFCKDTDSLKSALCEAVWDSKSETEDIRLDNGSSDIDTLDAFEYSFEEYIPQLTFIPTPTKKYADR